LAEQKPLSLRPLRRSIPINNQLWNNRRIRTVAVFGAVIFIATLPAITVTFLRPGEAPMGKITAALGLTSSRQAD
jgi:hypothetical protein